MSYRLLSVGLVLAAANLVLASVPRDWIMVGGIQAELEFAPPPTPPGTYQWPSEWGTDNGDGTFTYGMYTFPADNGARYCVLSVDNSIDSTAAYITQTMTWPGGLPAGNNQQQFLAYALDANPGGATGIWVEESYDTGGVDFFTRTATTNWQSTYFMVAHDAANSMTLKIGVTKNSGTTTGTRRVLIDRAMLWNWVAPNNWPNYDFEAAELVHIQESDDSTDVAEEGPTTDTYTIILADLQPTADVVVTVDPDAQVEVNSAGADNAVELTFTTSNWNVAQTVTVTAIDDIFDEGPHTSAIGHSAVSSDPHYNAINIRTVVVNVADNEVAGVTITESDGSTDVNEEGPTTDSYTLVLTREPMENVVITADPDAQTEVNGAGMSNPIELTFTVLNFNTAQTVTVTAIDDADYEGGPLTTHSSVVTHTITEAGPDYGGVSVENVLVEVTDNDEWDCSNESSSLWPDPNDEFVNISDFAQVASKWLSEPRSTLWKDAPLAFRGIVTSPYDYGRNQKSFYFTADWDGFLSEWSQEGLNAVVYSLSRELSYGIQGYLLLDEIPEAKELADATVIENQNQWKWVLARAKFYGLDNYLYSGTVEWTPAFGAAHGLDQTFPVSLTVHTSHNGGLYNCGIRNELTRAYTQAIFAECARTYEDLDGFYLCLGEPLPGKKSTWFQEAIAPGLNCTGGRQSHKPLVIVHQWHVPLQDYIDDIVNQDVYNNVWLGLHAYNSEQICDIEPWPFVTEWARKTGLPSVVMIYPANVYNFPFNSPELAYEIIRELKRVPNIKGFVYWDWAGVKLSPLFRKGLGYYGSSRAEYEDEQWVTILESQFGTRTAAEHFLEAFKLSSRIIPETCALVYGGHDNIRRELQIPFTWFLPGAAPYAWETSKVRGLNLVPVWAYGKMVEQNPALYEDANGGDPNHVTGQYSDYRQIPIWRTQGGSSYDVIPPVHMAKIAALGQACYDAATLGKAAAAAGEPYQTEAQNFWMFMKGYKLLSKYYESKVNAATTGIIYKLGGSSVTLGEAQGMFDAAYNDFVAWYNFVVTENPKLNDVMQAIYGQDIRDDNLGGKTMSGHLTQEADDKNNWQSKFNSYW